MSTKNVRAAVLTSTAPRHCYFHRIIAENFDLRVAMTQAKGNYYQKQRDDSELVRSHFADLLAAESTEFMHRLTTTPIMANVVSDINDEMLVDEALGAGVDMVFLFGTAILKDVWLKAFPGRIVNLHLGLSPFYRGSATLFWPFAEDELECLGTTIHLAVAKVDAGPILARVKPDFQAGDTYYTITNRLIRQSVDALPNVISRYLSGDLLPVPQSQDDRRVWRKADFSEEALWRALNNIGSGMTEEQITRIARSEICRCLQ